MPAGPACTLTLKLPPHGAQKPMCADGLGTQAAGGVESQCCLPLVSLQPRVRKGLLEPLHLYLDNEAITGPTDGGPLTAGAPRNSLQLHESPCLAEWWDLEHVGRLFPVLPTLSPRSLPTPGTPTHSI